jgi:prophage DNA circulation protein
MIDRRQNTEAFAIANRAIQAMLNFPITPGDTGAALRVAVGKFLGNFYQLIAANTVGTEMLGCFEAARAAGATLDSMDGAREVALLETPTHSLGYAVANAAVVFSFTEQCLIIADMVFASRLQVDVLMDRMAAVIEEIKLEKCNAFQVDDYRNVVATSALLFQHLSATERQLPRIVDYSFPASLPALTLANRIYADGSRSDELIDENHVVHPAFMPQNIVALSA